MGSITLCCPSAAAAVYRCPDIMELPDKIIPFSHSLFILFFLLRRSTAEQEDEDWMRSFFVFLSISPLFRLDPVGSVS